MKTWTKRGIQHFVYDSLLFFSSPFFFFGKSEEDGTKSSDEALALWGEKPIVAIDRWYLSPGMFWYPYV